VLEHVAMKAQMLRSNLVEPSSCFWWRTPIIALSCWRLNAELAYSYLSPPSRVLGLEAAVGRNSLKRLKLAFGNLAYGHWAKRFLGCAVDLNELALLLGKMWNWPVGAWHPMHDFQQLRYIQTALLTHSPWIAFISQGESPASFTHTAIIHTMWYD